jgi:hypothetical protein
MKLHLTFTFLLVLACFVAASAQSVDYLALERDFGTYTSLIVDLPANIEVDASKPSHGTLVTSHEDFNKIKWEVDGEALIISLKEGESLAGPVNFVLGGPALAKIESTFESIIYLHHFEGQRLDLDILKGSVKLEGIVEQLKVMAEKGRVYGSGMEATDADVKVWDEGSVVVHATESLQVEATNNGKVIYSGSPGRVVSQASNGGVIKSEESLQQQGDVEYVNFGV